MQFAVCTENNCAIAFGSLIHVNFMLSATSNQIFRKQLLYSFLVFATCKRDWLLRRCTGLIYKLAWQKFGIEYVYNRIRISMVDFSMHTAILLPGITSLCLFDFRHNRVHRK